MRAYLVAALAALALSAAVFVVSARGEGVSIPYDEPELVAAGAPLYQEYCASCHGADLGGQPEWRAPGADGLMPAPPHDETGHTWHHPDPLLFAITKRGSSAVIGGGYESKMLGFADVLTDEEILSVLAYIKSTWPRRVIETHNRINAQAGD